MDCNQEASLVPDATRRRLQLKLYLAMIASNMSLTDLKGAQSLPPPPLSAFRVNWSNNRQDNASFIPFEITPGGHHFSQRSCKHPVEIFYVFTNRVHTLGGRGEHTILNTGWALLIRSHSSA